MLLAGMLLALFVLPSLGRAQDTNPFVVMEKAVRLASTGVLANPKVKALQGGVMTVAPIDLRLAGATSPGELAEVDMMARAVQAKLSTAFINNGGENLEVVDQAVVEKAMTKLNIDLKSLNDPDNWKPLAEATGAQYILLSFMAAANDGSFTFDARLVDLESKRAIAAAGGVGSAETGEITMDGGEPAKP